MIFRAKGTLRAPRELALKKPPPRNKKRRAKGEFIDEQLNQAIGKVAISNSAQVDGITTVSSASEPSTQPPSGLTSEISTPLAYEVETIPTSKTNSLGVPTDVPQLTSEVAVDVARTMIAASTDPNATTHSGSDAQQAGGLDVVQLKQSETVEGGEENQLYCPECYLPLHPDPKPEKLYIFLHALRYTTSLGTFETEMPEWSAEGWEWDRS